MTKLLKERMYLKEKLERVNVTLYKFEHEVFNDDTYAVIMTNKLRQVKQNVEAQLMKVNQSLEV